MKETTATLDTLARIMNERFDGMEERMATKDDLRSLEKHMEERMATKEDLRNLEKRMEERMASKEDLRGVEERLSIKLLTYEQRWSGSADELTEKTEDHEKRINKLEDSVFVGLMAKRVA